MKCKIYNNGKLVNQWDDSLAITIWLLGVTLDKAMDSLQATIEYKEGKIIVTTWYTNCDKELEIFEYKIEGLPFNTMGLYNNKLYELLKEALKNG